MHTAIIRAFGAFNVWAYRLTGGRLLGRLPPNGAPVLLLTTTGRRSGRTRTVPLLYLRDGDDIIITGSQGGAPVDPGWIHNLRADPKAKVQIGRQRLHVTAGEVADFNRDRYWTGFVAIYPPYATYQQRTSRRIPLMRLRPAIAKGT